MRVYLDVSCLNRPFDDQWQDRIRVEAESITIIMERFRAKDWRHVSSEMVLIEISANPDLEKQRKVRLLLPSQRDILKLDEAIFKRAESIEKMGFSAADSVHLAAAEAQKADVFLSCDDKLLRAARRNGSRLAVQVSNPIAWLQEQHDAENT